MKAFSSEQIAALNRLSSTSKFVEAAIFTRDQNNPSNKDYVIHYGRKIVFAGNTYQPLDMAWAGLKVSSAMELPTNDVIVADIGGIISEYLEDPSVKIDGNDVILQILQVDKFYKVSLVDQMLYQVEIIGAEYGRGVTFHLGVNFSLNDVLPRESLEKQEFPGIRDDAVRVGT
jgi:hypothetical protein